MNTKATSEMLFEYHQRVEALEAENAKLKDQIHAWNRHSAICGLLGSEYHDDPQRIFTELQRRVRLTVEDKKRMALQARENSRLREALEQYADEENWGGLLGHLDDWLGNNEGPAVARRALGREDSNAD